MAPVEDPPDTGGDPHKSMNRTASVIGHAHDIEEGVGTLEDFRRASVKFQVIEDKAGGLTSTEKAMEKVKDKGLMSTSTVAANVMPGMNPFSVDQACVAILVKFRMKVFALLFLQNALVLVIALCFDFMFQGIKTGSGMTIAFLAWVVAVTALAVLAFVRKTAPWNYVMLLVFDLCGALALGSMRLVFDKLDVTLKAPPHLVCFGIHTLGIAAIGILSCKAFSGKGTKTCKVLLLTPIAIVITNVLFVYICAAFAIASAGVTFCFVLLNTIGLLWIGFHIDKLSSLLTVDEYMQPIIVIWCEIMVLMLLFMIVAFFIAAACLGESDGDTEQCGDCCTGCTCYWMYGCSTADDCCIHDNERERRERRREEELARRAECQLQQTAEAGGGSDSINTNVAGAGVAGAGVAGAGVAGAAVVASFSASSSTAPNSEQVKEAAPKQDSMDVVEASRSVCSL